jgi:uncharacterized protein HemY
LYNLGILEFDRDKYDQAEPLLKRALNLREKALGAEHPDVACSLESLGMLRLRQKNHAEAERLMKRVLSIYEIDLGPNHPQVANCCAHLADCCRANGHDTEAKQLEARARSIDGAQNQNRPPNRTVRGWLIYFRCGPRCRRWQSANMAGGPGCVQSGPPAMRLSVESQKRTHCQ